MNFKKNIVRFVSTAFLGTTLMSVSVTAEDKISVVFNFDGVEVNALLDNSAITNEFLKEYEGKELSMKRYADREYYGRIKALESQGEVLDTFKNGDITYYERGPSLAIFFDNDDKSELGGLQRLGKITDDCAKLVNHPESTVLSITRK